MIAEPVRVDVGLDAAERMAALVKDGMRPSDAALAVKEQMLKDGSAWELFVQQGQRLVMEAWRKHGGPAVAIPGRIAPIRGGTPALPSGPVVVRGQLAPEEDADEAALSDAFAVDDLDRPGNLLDAPMRIDGRWTTLGSLKRGECKALQFHCEAETAAFIVKAGLFKRLANDLKDNERVRERFTDKQLRVVLAELGA